MTLSKVPVGEIDVDCTLVVPCYNEEKRLNVAAFKSFLSATNPQEIGLLFVNDGSRDGTLSVLRQIQSEHPDRVMVLDLVVNSGKAEAVRQGLLQAASLPRTTIIGFWDADLATPLEELPVFLKILASKPALEMVFGARVKLLGREVHRQAARHYLGRCFATVASLVLQIPIYDTQCGAKLFRVTPVLREILEQPFHSRWIFDVELIARFIKSRNYTHPRLLESIYETPLTRWEDVKGSKVGPFDFLRAFGELGWIYLHSRKN
jgi:glycosyltransferase involved in cell wall biosynthesis